MPRVSRKRPPREPLTRERVLAAALRLVDERGAAGLSMRRLAAELGVEAMSIYNHVPNKETLLAGVLDLALAEVQLPPAAHADWRAWVREWMLRARRAFDSHPGLFPVLLTQTSLGANALKLIDGLFGTLAAAGFNADAQVNVWGVLKAFLLGTMVQERIVTDDATVTQALACCPNVVTLLPAMACCDLSEQFAYGLDILLAGMERARPA